MDSSLRMCERIERKRDGYQYPYLIAHTLLIFNVRWEDFRRAIYRCPTQFSKFDARATKVKMPIPIYIYIYILSTI